MSVLASKIVRFDPFPKALRPFTQTTRPLELSNERTRPLEHNSKILGTKNSQKCSNEASQYHIQKTCPYEVFGSMLMKPSIHKTCALTYSSYVRTYYTVKRKAQKDEEYVTKRIAQRIKATGPITVADYMREVLQNPLQGYYMSKDMFGEQGDFITSPEISQIFGEMIAVWYLNEWHKIGSVTPLNIIELGPGRGTLSNDIIKVFNHFKALHRTSLHLVEISPVLSDIQARTLCMQSHLDHNTNAVSYRQGVSHHGIPVSWYRQLKDVPETGFSLILAHEFFDALPVHKFHKTYGGYREVLIDLDSSGSNEIKFRYILARNETPMQKVLLNKDETREHVEISPDALLIYQEICKRLIQNGGIALICDYGHNGTGTDTFRAFKKHQQVDPLILPGTADLTADVDFKQLQTVALQTGDILSYGPVTQREFLKKTGLEYRVRSLQENLKDKKDVENLKSCYKFLTDENKMGERFKFACLIPATVKRILDKFPVVGF